MGGQGPIGRGEHMHFLTRFESLVQAESAARYLRENGILAKVMGHGDALGGLPLTLSRHRGQFVLMIAARADEDAAKLLLEEFHSEPIELEARWEDEALPDLSQLDPDLAPPCPSCGRLLPLDSSLEHCPGCGAAVDVLGLLVERHGPELIASLTPAEDEAALADLIERAPLCCLRCGYPLAGLAVRGRCPECGGDFDKARMIQRFIDR